MFLPFLPATIQMTPNLCQTNVCSLKGLGWFGHSAKLTSIEIYNGKSNVGKD
jgi:hypothetical protein